jgi:hypothetical protein
MKIIQAVLAGVLLAVTATGALAAESNTDPAAESGGWLGGPWHFSALIYGWLPHAPADITYRQHEVANLPEDLSTILDSLQMTAMLEFEAHKGRLGFFVSPVYYKGKYNQDFSEIVDHTHPDGNIVYPFNALVICKAKREEAVLAKL